MLNRENLEQFIKTKQTGIENVAREYCQHLFLSFLYQQAGSERLLFKGGTALRIIFKSPRFSEDLDFTGAGTDYEEIDALFVGALANIERSGIKVEIEESKKTSGGYLGIASSCVYGINIKIQIEVSLRNEKHIKGTRALVVSDYLPAYTLVHLPMELLVEGKIEALFARQKPRDFYDYFFLLSGDFPLVKNKENLKKVRELLARQKINFRAELKKFLPASHAMHLKDFKRVLDQKISNYLG